MEQDPYHGALGNDIRLDIQVIERALAYLAGGTLPWPYELDSLASLVGIKRLREPMREQAAQVQKLLGRRQPEVRRLAAAVYADFAGDKCIPRMQELLKDPDEIVRAIAVGILARHDAADAEAIQRAVRRHKEPHVACTLIESLRKWGKLQAVPALIEFLQNDGFSYQHGDDLGVPALKAQAALKEITGYDFPADVEASRRAWEKTKAIPDPKERMAALASKISFDPQPLACRIERDKEPPEAVLTNRSGRALILANEPTGIECRAGGGVYSVDSQRPEKKDDFTELPPGTSLHVKLDPGWAVRSSLERLSLYFLANGNEVGVKAWIGSVEMGPDPATRPAASET
jgi:hypothetical protein